MDQLHRLESAWRGVRQGRGCLVTVAGAAGVGKTRFCSEGADRARRAGFTVVWGRCWTECGAPALWPWQPILSELCGDDAAALLSRDERGDTVDPERFSRFLAVVDRLAEACARAPVLLVIDDLHAADPDAVLLTRFVARNLHRLALTMVVTYRENETKADLPAEAVPIALGCFGLDDTRAFLAAHGVEHPDPALTTALHRLTDGNPLYLRRMVALGAADPADLGLRDAIDRSLRRLRPTTVGLLSVSALLGMSVSAAEAGAMAEMSPLAVRDAVREADTAGLVEAGSPETFTFGHDLIRQALAATLTPGERLDAHARGAAILRAATVSGDSLVRRAFHAVNAAPRSTEDTREAVTACRAAAGSLVHHFAYEQAATLLATAAGLHETADLGPAPASLLLEWAHAVLSAGRLAEARPLFDRAAAAADAGQQPVLFAEAALGLGGIWINEHRGAVERNHALGMLRAALARLPPGHDALRCRLVARRAAEDVYDGGPNTGVLAALADARRIGDQETLAEALSLCHHALLTAEHTHTRLAIADELVAVAASAGLEGLALVGLCWRTVDLFHLGDARAERSLAELRDRADLLGCHSVLFIVAAIEVMLLIRAGKLDEAEDAAARCHEFGTQVGDADAFAYYSAHLLTIRWLQGRSAELVDLAEQTANSPTLVKAEHTFRATVARLAADAGQQDRARSALDRITADGLAAVPQSSTWLSCMLAVVEAAAALGDTDVAREAYDLLLPYADLPIMPSLGVVCFGSTQRALGVAAMTLGDLDRGIAHFERAVAENIRLANWPLTACARADLAEALRRRDAPGDRQRASALLATAVTSATAMGMVARAGAWTHGLDQALIELRRHNDRWLITYRGRQILVGDLVGMRFVARLLANPGTEIPALDLVTDGHAPETTNQAVLDDQARTAYAQRARDLARELAEARTDADLGRIEQLQKELDALTTEVERATGLGGRTRTFTGPAERARTAVRKAIKRAIDTIAAADPEIAATLRATVTTGYHCCYRPDAR